MIFAGFFGFYGPPSGIQAREEAPPAAAVLVIGSGTWSFSAQSVTRRVPGELDRQRSGYWNLQRSIGGQVPITHSAKGSEGVG